MYQPRSLFNELDDAFAKSIGIALKDGDDLIFASRPMTATKTLAKRRTTPHFTLILSIAIDTKPQWRSVHPLIVVRFAQCMPGA